MAHGMGEKANWPNDTNYQIKHQENASRWIVVSEDYERDPDMILVSAGVRVLPARKRGGQGSLVEAQLEDSRWIRHRPQAGIWLANW